MFYFFYHEDVASLHSVSDSSDVYSPWHPKSVVSCFCKLSHSTSHPWVQLPWTVSPLLDLNLCGNCGPNPGFVGDLLQRIFAFSVARSQGTSPTKDYFSPSWEYRLNWEPLTPFPDLHLLCVPRLLLSAIPQTAPSLPAARQPGIGLCLAS